MKRLTVFLMITVPLLTYAQGAFNNQTHSVLQQVISDFPNHFRNIRGNLINEDPQTTDYASTIQIPGTLNTIITHYSSTEDKEIYSWKCLVAEAEDFEEASQKYKDLYNQIKNSIIKINGEKPFILNGNFEVPTEDKRFITTAFYLLPAATGDFKKIKVEISLEYYVTEWKLALLVYDQDEAEVMAME